MRILHSARPLLLMGIFAACASADTVIIYTLNFSGGSPTPTSGSFTYDATEGLFTSFNVSWDGVSFDLLPSANGPVTQNYSAECDSGGSGAEFFALLTNGGECNGSEISDAWRVYPPNPPGNDFYTSFNIFLFNDSNSGYGIGGSDPDSTFAPAFTSGTFTMTQTTPEPAGATLALAGVLLLLRRPISCQLARARWSVGRLRLNVH
jgi:hypothetical protein